MVLRAGRLLLVGALVYAVVASAGRADASGPVRDAGAAGGSGRVVLRTLPAGADLAIVPVSAGVVLTVVAPRCAETAAERSGLPLAAGAALPPLALALALAARIDLAPTERLGLARRRAPPLLLAAHS
jgi:hypothetical protein